MKVEVKVKAKVKGQGEQTRVFIVELVCQLGSKSPVQVAGRRNTVLLWRLLMVTKIKGSKTRHSVAPSEAWNSYCSLMHKQIDR